MNPYLFTVRLPGAPQSTGCGHLRRTLRGVPSVRVNVSVPHRVTFTSGCAFWKAAMATARFAGSAFCCSCFATSARRSLLFHPRR
jgi:hypothetical protein